MGDNIRVTHEDDTYVVHPQVSRMPDGAFRGLVVVSRYGYAVRLDYECAYGRRSPEEALADAREMMPRVAKSLPGAAR